MSERDPGPEWADEAHLDEVFRTWIPGPPDDAPAAEREMAEHGDAAPAQAPLDEDLAAALSAALSDAPPAEPLVAQPAPGEAGEQAAREAAGATSIDVPEPPPAPEPERRRPSPFDFTLPVDEASEEVAAPASTAEPDPAPAAEPAAPPAAPPAPATPAPTWDAFSPTEASAPAAPAGKVARPWTRSDDDVLPDRKGRSRRRRD